MTIYFQMNLQPDSEVYKNFIESLSVTLDNVITLDNVSYFKQGELDKNGKNSVTNEEVLYSNMFDVVSNIFTGLSPLLEANNHVSNFKYDIVNNVLSSIISEQLLSGASWNFDLNKKFLWITLLHCVKSAPMLISFLINKIDDKISLVTEEDNNGNDLVMHSCYNIESLIEIIKCTDKAVLFRKNKLGITPIEMILSNGSVGFLLDTKMIDIGDLRLLNRKGMNFFHICSIFNNDHSIRFLLNYPECTTQDLLATDCNQNTPSMTAVIYKNYKIIQYIIESQLFTLEAFTKSNLQNKNVFSFTNIPNLINMMLTKNKLDLEFINNNYGMFLTYFKRANFANINELINSNYFECQILYKQGENIIESLITNNPSVLYEQLNNNKVVKVICEVLNINPSIYSLICRVDMKIALRLLNLNLVTSSMIEAEYDNNNAISNILTHSIHFDENLSEEQENNTEEQEENNNDNEQENDNNDDGYDNEEHNEEQENNSNEQRNNVENMSINERLLRGILNIPLYDYKYLNFKCNNRYALTLIFSKFSQLFLDLIKQNKIDQEINRPAIVECLKQNNYDSMKEEVILSYLVNKETLKNNDFELLKFFLKNDFNSMNTILDNYERFLEENYFIDSGLVKDICLVSDDNFFEKIMNHPIITTKNINFTNSDNESIINYFTETKRLEKFLQLRPDFNKNLLYNQKLLTIPMNNNLHLLSIILIQEDLPQEYYINFIEQVLNSPDRHNYKTYVNLILHSKMYFELSEKMIGDLMHFCVKNRVICLSEMLSNSNLSENSFSQLDSNGNNLLFNSLKYNFKQKEIVNHKYFKKEFLLNKNNDGLNVLSKLNSNFDSDVLHYCLINNIMDKSTLTALTSSGETMLHIMVRKGYITQAIDIILSYNDKSLLTDKLDKKTNILYEICKHEKTDLDISFFVKLGIEMSDLLEVVNGQHILFVLYEHNYSFFVKVVKNYKLTKEILWMHVPNTKHKFISYALQMRPEFVEILDCDLLIDNDILNLDMKENRLLCFINPSVELFKQIIESNKFDTGILQEYYKNNKFSNLEILCEANPDLGRIYFSHKKADSNLLFQNNNQFLKNICKKHPQILKVILQEKLIPGDLELIQEMTLICCDSEKESINELFVPKCFIEISESQYFNTDLLRSNYKDKTFIEHLSKNQCVLQYLLSRNKFPQEMLFEIDSFGDPTIIHFRYDMNNLSNILKYITPDNLRKTNNCGQTLLHILAMDNCFNDLTSLNIPEEIYLLRDNFGKLYLDYIVEYQNQELLINLLNNKIVTSKVLCNVDKIGRTILSKIIKTFPKTNSKIIDIIDNQVLSIKNSKSVNNLGIIIKYSPVLLGEILKRENVDLTLLDNVDNKGRTCLMLAAQYSSNNLVTLLNHPYIKPGHMMLDRNLGSCLTKAIRYNPKDVRYILQSNLMNNGVLYSRENEVYNGFVVGLNIVQLACKYSPDALMFILDSGKNLQNLVYEIIGKSKDKINSLKISILYQPECVEVLLKSVYGTNEIIKQTNTIMSVSCLTDAAYKQPASFPILLKYGKFEPCDIEYNESNPLNIINAVIKIKHEILTVSSDFYKEVPLMKNKNEPCEADDVNVCAICSENKSNIIFDPCGHKSCVSCSMRIVKCHMCRIPIEKRFSI